MTTSSNNTNDENGLYQSTQTNTGKPTYYFRGVVENNYVVFAEQLWRIVRINEDETVRLIKQDGINDNTLYYFNQNNDSKDFMYYSESDVNNGLKNVLDNWYLKNIDNQGYSKYIQIGNYFCEQARVTTQTAYADIRNNGTIMNLYSDYIPNFKCSVDENGKGLVNSNIGLISYDEVVYAGGYHLQQNSNYYLYNNNNFWMISPGGFSSTNAAAWYVQKSGNLHMNTVIGSETIRPVINLNTNTKAVGLGTSDKPFIVE